MDGPRLTGWGGIFMVLGENPRPSLTSYHSQEPPSPRHRLLGEEAAGREDIRPSRGGALLGREAVLRVGLPQLFPSEPLLLLLSCRLVSDHSGPDPRCSRRRRPGSAPPPLQLQQPSPQASPCHPLITPFFPLTLLSSSSPPILLSQTAALLPLFHVTLRTPLPRSSPRPVFIRGALAAHSSVGLIHHHHEERVRGVGAKTGGGGKAERDNGKSQKSAV